MIIIDADLTQRLELESIINSKFYLYYLSLFQDLQHSTASSSKTPILNIIRA